MASSVTAAELKSRLQANKRRAISDPQLLAAMSTLRSRVSEIESRCPSPKQDSHALNDTWISGSIPARAPSGEGRTPAKGPKGGQPRSSLAASCSTFDQQLTARLSVGVLGEFNEFGHPYNSTQKLMRPSDLTSSGGQDYSKPWLLMDGPSGNPGHGWTPGRDGFYGPASGVWKETATQRERPGPKGLKENNPHRHREWARLLSVGKAGDD